MALGKRRTWIWRWKVRSQVGFNVFQIEMIALYLIIRGRGHCPLDLSWGSRYFMKHLNGIIRRTFLESKKPLSELTGTDIYEYVDRHYPQSAFRKMVGL
jgi:hypothetical protein